MDLRTYLFETRITQKDFAAMAGCDRATICKISNGKAWPRKGLAKSIEKITEGKVKVKDVMKGKPESLRICPHCGHRRKNFKVKQPEMF